MTDVPLHRRVKAARALLGWSQKTLAKRAEVGVSTVADFERGARETDQRRVGAIMGALLTGGALITDDGARIRGP
jgi:ribosome-binding protein aMBF1 (putative translation factor)